MFSNSVSSRSVLARRCSRETATLEGWRSGPGTAPARILAGEEVVRIADLKAEDSRAAKLSPDEQREVRFALDSLLERNGFEPSVPLAINAVGGTVCRGSAQPCHAYPQVGAGAVRSFRPRSGSCRPNRLLLTIGRMHSTRFGARAEEVARIGPIDIFHDGTHSV